MPAAITAIPTQGLVAAKPAPSPAAAGTVDGFLGVLQSLKGSAGNLDARAAGGNATNAGLQALVPSAGRGQAVEPDNAPTPMPSGGPTKASPLDADAQVAPKDAAVRSGLPTLPALAAGSASAGTSAGTPMDPTASTLPSSMADSGAGNAVATTPLVPSAQPPALPQAVTPDPAPATPTTPATTATAPPATASAPVPASPPVAAPFPQPNRSAASSAPPPEPASHPAAAGTAPTPQATPQASPDKASAAQAADATAPVASAVQATPAGATRNEPASLPTTTPAKAVRAPTAPQAAATSPTQAPPEPEAATASPSPAAPDPASAQPAPAAALPPQPADSASQQPPAPPPPAVAARDPVPANRAAPSDKPSRARPPVAQDFNDPPAAPSTQPAVATTPSPPEATPGTSTSVATASAWPGGGRAGPSGVEATPQPLASAVGATAGATGTQRNGASKEPAPAPSASTAQAIPQAAPQDTGTAAPPRPFPALAELAASGAQPSANPAPSAERKDLLKAVAASAPLRADPIDPSAQQAIGLPASNQPAPTAAPAPATPPHAPTPTTPPPPAAQLAPALLSLGQGGDGGQQMTLRLHPDDLGMVQVRIDRSAAGVATVEITVEKADTMQALLRDQAQLHHALDQAGVSSVGRTVTFTMAPDASLADAGGSPNFGQGSQQGSQQAGQHGSGGGAAGADGGALGSQNGGGQSPGGRGAPNQDQGAYAGGRRNGTDTLSPSSTSQATAGKWLRVGLNITA